jgi:hypothetical protein
MGTTMADGYAGTVIALGHINIQREVLYNGSVTISDHC